MQKNLEIEQKLAVQVALLVIDVPC